MPKQAIFIPAADNMPNWRIDLPATDVDGAVQKTLDGWFYKLDGRVHVPGEDTPRLVLVHALELPNLEGVNRRATAIAGARNPVKGPALITGPLQSGLPDVVIAHLLRARVSR